MIRSRAKVPRRIPRGKREGSSRNRQDEPLRVLVRILARQAARQRFERDIANERETASEVTLH